MAADDHPQTTPPDWEDWVRQQLAEPEAAALGAHRWAKRRRRLLVAAGAVAALAAVGGAFYLTCRTGKAAPAASHSTTHAPTHAPTPAASPAVSVKGVLPSNAPSALPSLLARPVVRPEQAFPDSLVTAPSGARYQRVDVFTTGNCATMVSQELNAVFGQPGNACLQSTSALYTDERQKSRVTVTVLSFRQAEGMAAAFGMASLDPLTYQTVSLDPPKGSPLPAADPNGQGVFKRLATVRSVVFVNGQWADAANQDEAGITTQTTDLLGYVDGKVTAYEQG